MHLLDRAQTLLWLRRILPKDELVGCSIVYDLGCAAAADSTLLPLIFDALDAGRIHDIGIREALIDIARGDLADRDGLGERYGMKLLASRYLGLNLIEAKKGGWRKRFATLDGTPIEQWPWGAREYALRDAAYPLEIYRLQEGGENLHDEIFQVQAAFALQLACIWGIRANRKSVAELKAKLLEIDRLNTIEFQRAGILRADGSEDQMRLKELVTAAYGEKPPTTKTGRVAIDRDTLSESGDELLEKYATAGKNDKYLSTYLPLLEEGIETPWNPEYNVLVATTRVSSNAQQFPQNGGIRECYESRPGTVFCSVDYGGGELRTMAQISIWEKEIGFSKLADALTSGLDPHLVAAASFMRVTYDEAAKSKSDPRTKTYRDMGKVWNFGKGGGMGPSAMVYNSRSEKSGRTKSDGFEYLGARFCILVGGAKKCGVKKEVIKVKGVARRVCSACVAEAKKLDAGWLKAFPDQEKRFKLASKLIGKHGRLTAVIPVSNVKRGDCGYTQYLNTPFQGLLAVATKRAMYLVVKEMYAQPDSALFGSRLVLNVHDELIAEMPEEKAPEAGDRMAEIMREELKKCVPDLANAVEAEPALSRIMSKHAKTLRDANGRLMVWS